MVIETDRLIIREFIENDKEAVHEYASDPLVTRYTLWGPNTIEDTESFLGRMLEMQLELPRTGYELAIVSKACNRLIGGCGIYLDGTNGEIGYTLHKEYWQQGFATEAAQAMLSLGFNTYGLHRIHATCRPGNIGSAKVLEKIGMTREGLLREHLWSKNTYHSSYLFSILEHEYRRIFTNAEIKCIIME